MVAVPDAGWVVPSALLFVCFAKFSSLAGLLFHPVCRFPEYPPASPSRFFYPFSLFRSFFFVISSVSRPCKSSGVLACLCSAFVSTAFGLAWPNHHILFAMCMSCTV